MGREKYGKWSIGVFTGKGISSNKGYPVASPAIKVHVKHNSMSNQ